MAELADLPHPPGRYPLVVVGSGPGGLQVSYTLRRLGVEHALLSEDDAPGGMFRRWPVFQRMLSWTKPFTPFEHRTREYERYDWNSLVADEAEIHLYHGMAGRYRLESLPLPAGSQLRPPSRLRITVASAWCDCRQVPGLSAAPDMNSTRSSLGEKSSWSG